MSTKDVWPWQKSIFEKYSKLVSRVFSRIHPKIKVICADETKDSKLYKHFQLQKLYASSDHDYIDNREAEAASFMTKNPTKLTSSSHGSSFKR